MGTLSIVSTPIGNLDDITIRAIKTLLTVDIVLCEDTRRTGNLLAELRKRYASLEGSHPSNHRKDAILRFDDHTENNRVPEIIQWIEQDKNVALVSDAGTPLISDPGYRLVSEALKRGINVVSVPGPTAAIAALTSSGLPTNQFLFLGYPPEKQSHRIKLFQSLSEIFTRPPLAVARGSLDKSPTLIFYCAPHKLHQTLTDLQTVFGDIPIVIARELTKVHEEVWRGKLYESLGYFYKPQGEFVLLF